MNSKPVLLQVYCILDCSLFVNYSKWKHVTGGGCEVLSLPHSSDAAVRLGPVLTEYFRTKDRTNGLVQIFH